MSGILREISLESTIDSLKYITFMNFPDLHYNYLHPGISSSQLITFHQLINPVRLPTDIIEFFTLVNGEGDQFNYHHGNKIGVCLGAFLLNVDQIVEMRYEFGFTNFLPLICDKGGNFIGVQMSHSHDPEIDYSVVIVGEEYEPLIIHNSWPVFLQEIVKLLIRNDGTIYSTGPDGYQLLHSKSIVDYIHKEKMKESDIIEGLMNQHLA